MVLGKCHLAVSWFVRCCTAPVMQVLLGWQCFTTHQRHARYFLLGNM